LGHASGTQKAGREKGLQFIRKEKHKKNKKRLKKPKRGYEFNQENKLKEEESRSLS